MRDPEKAYKLEISKLESKVTELEAKLEVAIHLISLAIGQFMGDEDKALGLEDALAQLNNGEVK